MKRWSILVTVLVVLLLAAFFRRPLAAAVGILVQRLGTKKTVAQQLDQYGPAARARLAPFFAKQSVPYPPRSLVLVAVKDEDRLEVHAADSAGKLRFIRAYPVLAASGTLGPKLQEGDGQVPEGIYRIESLNPNSRFHLSLRIGYPNDFDREQARRDGRTKLGGDIMIHGKAVSIGCLAMGDEAAEDLFVLAADTGVTDITVILTPVDFRLGKPLPKSLPLPAWAGELYASIKTELSRLEKPR